MLYTVQYTAVILAIQYKLPEELQNSSGINISTNTALWVLHGVDFRGQAAADAT